MVLSLSRVVIADRGSDALERLVALGVVDLEGAGLDVSNLGSSCVVIKGANTLSLEVQSDGKVLPLIFQDGSGPDLLVLAIQHLPRVPGETRLAKDRAGLKVELVGRIISGLVPHVQVLVAQVERSLRIPLETKVDSFDARASGASAVGIPLELEASATEAALLLEDGLVADGHLERFVGLAIIEPGAVDGGELDDLRPLDVVALDVVWVEDGGAVAVKVGQLGGGLDPAVEDDGTLDLPCGDGMAVRTARTGEGRARQQGEDECVMHLGLVIKSRQHQDYGMAEERVAKSPRKSVLEPSFIYVDFSRRLNSARIAFSESASRIERAASVVSSFSMAESGS